MKTVSLKGICLILFVFIGSLAIAQKIVTGIITDKTNKPIEGVRIFVIDTDTNKLSDQEGRYKIQVPAGYFVLKFIKSDYQPLESVITSDTLNVTLTPTEDAESLEELMMRKISIVSKKSEKNFDAPLSSSVITKKDIINSGATSIPEALRLVPGFIIREQTNGVYDAHIRGFDYIINSVLSYASNTITLVMIDGRPVFKDFQGGTFWESLPIGLSDIERIEVIRGASSSMYGANAVSGVINIITNRFKDDSKDNEYLHADIQNGNLDTRIYSFNSGIRKGKLSTGISGNMQQRNRAQTTYYDIYRRAFVPIDSVLNRFNAYAFTKTKNIRYPNPENSNNLYGINSYLNYQINKKIMFDLSYGLQKSQIQKAYVDLIYTPLSTELSESEYINLNAKIYGFNIQASHNTGYQNTLIGGGWEYEYSNDDMKIEYNFSLLKDKIQIISGYNYRSALYSDSLSQKSNGAGTGFINNDHALLFAHAGYARIDYQINRYFRVISSIRLDQYNYPDKQNFSYQYAATYKPNSKNLIRVVVSKANKGPIILDNFFDFNFRNYFVYQSNKNLNLTTINLYEIGYRKSILNFIDLDLELFHQIANNYIISSIQDSTAPGPPPYGVTNYYSPRNFTIKPAQTGVTLSLIYHPNSKIIIKSFGTWQKTTIPDENKLISQYDSVRFNSDWTPDFYYGLMLNYSVSNKLNFNANIYGFSQIYFHDQDFGITDVIKDKVLLNLKTSYQINNNLSVYLNLRNLNLVSLVSINRLNPNSDRQFGFTDDIKPLVLFGLNINL